MVSTLSLTQLRSRFAGLPTSASKQIGLRAIKEAIALQGRNPERVEELRWKAVYHLPYAEAAR